MRVHGTNLEPADAATLRIGYCVVDRSIPAVHKDCAAAQ